MTYDKLIARYYQQYGSTNTITMRHYHMCHWISIHRPDGKGLDFAIPPLPWQANPQLAFDNGVKLIHQKLNNL